MNEPESIDSQTKRLTISKQLDRWEIESFLNYLNQSNPSELQGIKRELFCVETKYNYFNLGRGKTIQSGSQSSDHYLLKFISCSHRQSVNISIGFSVSQSTDQYFTQLASR